LFRPRLCPRHGWGSSRRYLRSPILAGRGIPLPVSPSTSPASPQHRAVPISETNKSSTPFPKSKKLTKRRDWSWQTSAVADPPFAGQTTARKDRSQKTHWNPRVTVASILFIQTVNAASTASETTQYADCRNPPSRKTRFPMNPNSYKSRKLLNFVRATNNLEHLFPPLYTIMQLFIIIIINIFNMA